MQVNSHGDVKYSTGHRLRDSADWNALRVECWRHEHGVLTDVHLDCTEVAVLLAGQLNVRRTGDGEIQTAFGRAGTSWICPAGVYETDIELSAPMEECVHIFLPPTLLEQSALENYGIDPAKARLGYAGGLSDPLLVEVALSFRKLLDQGPDVSDRLLVDGLRTTLAARLMQCYSAENWQPAIFKSPNALDGHRLRRVLDFIEHGLATELTLEDLAAQACMSPFHFARLFRQTTGLTPHRYVTERRIAVAKEKLALGRLSFTEIALETGFGSPANFSRAFRKATGCSPGQFRKIGF
ncbi:AraC family transcriptional regulator [Sphingobium sp. Sx8-8]|uniref:helix-turn-helix domain-containing protein n=1 Tax=Sphingobium sp. Sx8-8 TaxID=2933617 RepID=UPI001F5AB666|nr:AraC family transcriptional regulator [Sphingobium sp. Sx8-8]